MGIYIKIILSTFFWGLAYVMNKIQAMTLSPMSNTFVKVMLFSLFLILIYMFSKYKKRDFKLIKEEPKILIKIFVAGMLSQTVFFYLYYTGLQFIEASFAVVLSGVFLPLFQFVLAVVFLSEKINKKQTLYFIIALLGIVLVSYESLRFLSFEFNAIFGIIMVGLAQFSYGIFAIQSKNIMKKISVFGFLTYAVTLSSISVIVPFFFIGDYQELINAPLKYWMVTVYGVCFAGVLALYWWQEGIRKLPISKVSNFYILTPIWGFMLSYFILDERVALLETLGAIIAISGIYLSNKVK